MCMLVGQINPKIGSDKERVLLGWSGAGLIILGFNQI